MASIAHIAVGLAAARIHTGRRLGWAAAAYIGLSMLPDADVLAFALDIPYTATWGHRGASHSLAMALGVGLVVGALGRLLGQPVLRTFLLSTLVVASHGLLDTLTTGGEGVALFWPCDSSRHFFEPWRPIPVSPIGLNYFSPRGLQIAAFETFWSLPLWCVAFWPRGLRTPLPPPDSPAESEAPPGAP
jgi:inner membrane protein